MESEISNTIGNNEKDHEGFLSFLTRAETQFPEPRDKEGPGDETPPFLFSFLTDLVYCIKNKLVSINNFAFLPVEKLYDMEYRTYTQNRLQTEIKEIDTVLNSLLNYIHINTPLVKTNTLQIILEEILEANEKSLRERNIQVHKRFENHLPETFMHSEHVRFILNSLVQFAILSTPPNGQIGFLIKYLDPTKDSWGGKLPGRPNGGFIAVGIAFSAGKNGEQSQGDLPDKRAEGAQPSKEDPAHLILKLAEEIMQKNRGALKFEVDEKRKRSLIKLRFHVERRKSVYYEPIHI